MLNGPQGWVPGAVMTWDARDRLVSLSGATTASFQYDPLGRRTRKVISGTTTDFLYDGVNPVQELSGGTVVATLLTGLGVDEYFTRTDAAGTTTLLADVLGSTLAATDATGTVQTQYTYESFGATTVSGATTTNPFQYTGRENDGIALYYDRARYYHPTLQRFVSEDPIEFFGGSFNLYRYVNDNPIKDRDPLGTFGPAGAAGAAAFNLGYQLVVNLVASDFDLARAVGCINVTDVAVSAAVGFVGPSFIPNVFRGLPTVLGGRTENTLIWLTTSLPLSTSIKLAAPNIRLGARKDCEGLSTWASLSKIIGPQISMNRTGIHVILLFAGTFACVAIAARRWRRPIYRLLPFAYATAYAIELAYERAASLWDAMPFLVGTNLVAAILMVAFIVSGAVDQ